MPRRRLLYGGITLISIATLTYELALMRFFALTEWYHFAFLSISVALMGYASSGTLLFLTKRSRRRRLWPWLCLLFPLSILGCQYVINKVPLDSYQLAWSRRQLLYLATYYIALVIPFAVGGYILAYWLSVFPKDSHRVYAANLIGSALGSLAILLLVPLLGEGTFLAAATLASLGAALLLCLSKLRVTLAPLALGLAAVCALMSLRVPEWGRFTLSPYKSLSYALQASNATLGYQRWGTYARLDVVHSPQIHSAPGLSLNYQGVLPLQHGLTLDGDNLCPISQRITPEDGIFLSYLPSSVPYRLRENASALIVYPRGGLDVAVALQHQASHITVVEEYEDIVHLIRDVYRDFTGQLYSDPRVTLEIMNAQSALAQCEQRYDIVQFSLYESFHPLATGAYSLSENYLYTVQSFTAALHCLEDDGLLVITRWLQEPPSESVRAGALLITAMEEFGITSPEQHLLAFRSWSTMTLLASPSPLAKQDLTILTTACRDLGYDLVYYPDMPPGEANRHNVLPKPIYWDAFQQLLVPGTRAKLYRDNLYDLRPPTDSWPFFGHYFRWRQVPLILKQLGKTWQPFGGSGFLLVLALLILSVLAALILAIVPLLSQRQALTAPSVPRILAYFAALGLGYLLVEMPILQQFILYLGQPAISFSVVLCGLLLASGIGSMLAPRVSLRGSLLALIGSIAAYPFILQWVFQATLTQPLLLKMGISVLCILPLGLLMGIPFAGGLRISEAVAPGLVPWIWAINGSASVIGAIAATIIALLAGYHAVLALALICYAGALVAFKPLTRPL